MSEVKWLLENDVFDEDLEPLIAEIERQGMEVKVQRHRPFDTERDDIATWYDPDDCVVFYGSIGFAKMVQRNAPWVPGVYCNWDNYRCSHYYPAFGDRLLNKDYIMLPFGELQRRKTFLYDTLGSESDHIFIRPDRSDKIFTGKTVQYDSFAKDIEMFGFYGVEPHEICVVSSPKNIVKEWRAVVVEGEVVAISEYKPDHRRLDPTEFFEVYDLAMAAIEDSQYYPDKAWTIDLCRTVSDCQYVLEVGSFSCAGLYECDPGMVVASVSKVALKEWKEIHA